jgi:DNA-binding NarL/FixJ family response regulator
MDVPLRTAVFDQNSNEPRSLKVGVTVAGGLLADLTKRQRMVAEAISRGLTNKAIAHELGIAEKTAGHHVSSIIAKLGVGCRTEVALQYQAFLTKQPGDAASEDLIHCE